MKASDVKLDMRVSYQADSFNPPRYGVVTSAIDSYVRVRFDGNPGEERVYAFWLKDMGQVQTEIEKDYDNFCDEMNAKISAATKLLQEAATMAEEIGEPLRHYSDWSDLKDVVDLYIDTSPTYESNDGNEWECSF